MMSIWAVLRCWSQSGAVQSTRPCCRSDKAIIRVRVELKTTPRAILDAPFSSKQRGKNFAKNKNQCFSVKKTKLQNKSTSYLAVVNTPIRGVEPRASRWKRDMLTVTLYRIIDRWEQKARTCTQLRAGRTWVASIEPAHKPKFYSIRYVSQVLRSYRSSNFHTLCSIDADKKIT